MLRIGLTTLLVRDYDEAIRFYVDAIGFHLVADTALGGQTAGSSLVPLEQPVARSSSPVRRQMPSALI